MEVARKILKLASQLVILFLFFIITSFDSDSPANRLLGVWESEEKNLQIEMFEEGGYYTGKTLWFPCSSGEMICSHYDLENPDPKLTHRPLIGLKVVEKISYEGNNTWGSGKIYDPNSGHTYDAEFHLIAPNTLSVRGYWKFKWFGKSMVFHRLERFTLSQKYSK